MRHEIEWLPRPDLPHGGSWTGAILAWDDVAGTLEWARRPQVPDEHPRTREAFMEDFLRFLDTPSDQGRVVIDERGRATIDNDGFPVGHIVLEDPAHDRADFLSLLLYYEGGSHLRMPSSLQGVRPTPPEPFDPDPGLIY